MPVDRSAWAYFDTSVLVKCYVAEHGTPKAVSLIGRHGVLSSTLAPIELASALRSLEVRGGLTRRQRERARISRPHPPTRPSLHAFHARKGRPRAYWYF